jgi:hypothetical protein
LFLFAAQSKIRSGLPSAKNHCLDGFTGSPRPVQRWPVTVKTI